MPLTPKLLIMFYDSDVYKVGTRKGKVVINKQNEIEEINKLIASEAYELLVYNPKYHITSSVKEYAQRLKASPKTFKFFNNKQNKLPFIHILDKAKSLNLKSCYQEDLFREYANYLIKNPDVRKYLEALGGTASIEDKHKLYEELRKESESVI